MSIESDRKSDIYDRMLEENSYTANHLNMWNRNSTDNNLNNEWNIPRRNSEEQRSMRHSCDCYPSCLGQECPCFLARDEMCVKDHCCETCIQMKNTLLLADRG